MIFVTVGTTKFPFNRLLKSVDEALANLDSKERLIVQAGASDYQIRYKNKEIFKEIPFDRMINFFKKARLVITHSGPASIFLSLKYGQSRPLVVPRSKKFGEHVNDHQVFFAEFLKKKQLVETGEIAEFIRSSQKVSKKRELLPSKLLIKRLMEYTENLK